jgi:hypothetical protein
MSRRWLTPDAERSVVSIAVALESNCKCVALQPDLFGGGAQLVVSPYAQYHAELARRVCATAYAREVRA